MATAELAISFLALVCPNVHVKSAAVMKSFEPSVNEVSGVFPNGSDLYENTRGFTRAILPLLQSHGLPSTRIVPEKATGQVGHVIGPPCAERFWEIINSKHNVSTVLTLPAIRVRHCGPPRVHRVDVLIIVVFFVYKIFDTAF